MHILQFNQYAAVAPYCAPYRPIHLARQWARQGHKVLCVSASFSHLYLNQPAVARGMTHVRTEGFEQVFLRTMSYQGNGVRRALAMLQFTGSLLARCKTFCEFKPDLVIAGTTHLLDSYPAALIARRCGARFVREVRDLWPLTLTEIGKIPPWHPIVWLIQRAENYSYRAADKVVTTLSHSYKHMEKHGLALSKWCLIPQGVDFATIPEEGQWPVLEEPHSTVLRAEKAKGRLIVAYTGSLGLAYSLETLVAAADLMRNEPVAFLIVGRGPVEAALQGAIQRRQLANVHLLPPVSKNALFRLLSEVDVTFNGWAKTPIFRYGVSPNKVMDYMAAGKPVIHAAEIENEIVTSAGCGFRVEPENPDAIAGCLRRLLAMSEEERRSLGRRGRKYIEENCDYRVLAERYLAEAFK